MRLGDQYQYVRAHLFWVNTIADGLANEHLIGRIQNRTSSPRLSRGCHCPQHLADESHLSCNFLKQAAIERLTVAALGPSLDPENKDWNEYLGSLGTNKEKKAAEYSLKTSKRIAQALLKMFLDNMLLTLSGSMLIKDQTQEGVLDQHQLIQCMHLRKASFQMSCQS